MSALIRYDEACRALSAAVAIDEVKDLRDKAEALRHYARQAKNRTLEVDAAEIRLRAERRLGEMLAHGKAEGRIGPGRPENGHDDEPFPRVTLAELGIDKPLSSRAQRLAAVSEERFEGLLDDWRERVSRESERVSIALLVAGDKAARRVAREAALGAAQSALPAKRYGVIWADPEWRFEVRSRETGLDRAADNHYPTSPTAEIAARPVAEIAAEDCVLFLWATVPMLPDALAVMAAWGFAYKSHQVWAKDQVGTGYWFRNRHELLLVGTRGHVPAPAPGTQSASLVAAPVAEHSRKPAVFMEMVERLYPTLPKIELNARATRAGWDAWGNETGRFDARENAGAASEAALSSRLVAAS